MSSDPDGARWSHLQVGDASSALVLVRLWAAACGRKVRGIVSYFTSGALFRKQCRCQFRLEHFASVLHVEHLWTDLLPVLNANLQYLFPRHLE
jgi:hypothetical protein